MVIINIGINHKTAPLESRERLVFSEKHMEEAFAYIEGDSTLTECVVLSTCNRTELYAVSMKDQEGSAPLLSLLQHVQGVSARELARSTYFFSGEQAVERLFYVTSGLDSMILGETQVLGQVREAYEKAVSGGAVGKILHTLFRQALYSAKRVQTETGINQKSASISYAAVDLAKKRLGSLQGLRVLVIGAGKMSRLTLKHLHAMGTKDIYVTSRTWDRAEALASCFGGRTLDFKDRREALQRVDIVITSTGAPHIIIKKEEVEEVMQSRRDAPLFFIDIAVPRDIDSGVKAIKNVFLYDIDDLQDVVTLNMKEREKDALQAKDIIAEEVKEFQAWLKTLEAVPVIKALRQKANDLRRTELEKTFSGKLSRLNPKEKTAVENLTKAIINGILKEPILRVKRAALEDQCEPFLQSLNHLFGLADTRGEENCDEGP